MKTQSLWLVIDDLLISCSVRAVMKNLLIFNLSCLCTCQEHGEDGFVQYKDDYDPSHEDVLIIIKCTADF